MANLSKFGSTDNGFDTTNEEEMSDFSPLAPDDYVCRIKKSEMKKTKANTDMLALQFEVAEGTYKGRILFTNLNIGHNNPDAVGMARKELTSIIKACGLVAIEDSEELHGIEMTCTVVKTAATANYPAGNEIKGYEALEGASAPSGSSAPKSGSAKKAKKKVSFT